MDAIAIIKYFCAVAVGAVGSALYICNTYTLGKRRGLGPLRPLRILISGAAGRHGDLRSVSSENLAFVGRQELCM